MVWKIWFMKGMELLFLGIGSWMDLRTRELSVSFLGLFGVLSISCNVFWNYQSAKSLFAGCTVGILFLVIGWMTRESIGYGDGLAILILGIFEGGKNIFWIVFGAFLLGGIYGGYRMAVKKSKAEDTFPFFPFLMFAALGVWI